MSKVTRAGRLAVYLSCACLACLLAACTASSSAATAGTSAPPGAPPAATGTAGPPPAPGAAPEAPSAYATTSVVEPDVADGGTPAPESSPAPVSLRRLTEPGCCARPWWSGDSGMLLYVDGPDADGTPGVWGVPASGAAPPARIAERPVADGGNPGFRLWRISPSDVLVERAADGRRWTVDSGGHEPHISPDGRLAVWVDTSYTEPYDQRRATLYVAEFGAARSAHRLLATVWGGGFVAWLPDSRSIVLVGRPDLGTHDRELSILPVAGGAATLLLREEFIENIALSPDGKYVLCTVFFSRDPARNGVWLLGTGGEEPRKMRFYGAYAWRDSRRIVYVPPRASAADSFVFRQYEILSRRNVALTDPASTFFSIANDDWTISADGSKIAFVDSRDRAIWLLDLEVPAP